jgi:hypothetical protein
MIGGRVLPLLHLEFQILCQTALDFGRLDGSDADSLSDTEIERACQTYTGQSFAFKDEQLENKANNTGQNLDQILSHELLYGFTRNPIKRKSLLWFGRRFGCVIVTICDIKGQLDPQWMCTMTGYFESGSDYVGRTDRPYAYWDGHNFHRIYPDVKMESLGGVLVADFGDGFGWSVGETDAEDISAVLAANPDSWEYSIVPADHEEIVTVNDARCLLLHSRYREAR